MFRSKPFSIVPNSLRLAKSQCLLVLWCVCQTSHQAPATEIDFTRDVRPILSDNCFRCHGPDENVREADLRLDTLSGLTEDLGGYSAIDRNQPQQSVLLDRILSDDPDLQMPPPDSNKTLSRAEKETLKQWVLDGAPWEQHWAFEAPTVPSIPTTPTHDDWSLTNIDRFILRRLKQDELQPAQDAPPYILVRRLYLDLIGLQPTIEEADRWVDRIWGPDENSIDETAYQELITHLLNSPHYGERWARRWLDLARYADTNGYEKDRERTIWPFRDWVIRSLNADMPYDQFTIEQLAGDMLPNATIDQHIATGFHRNSMLNEEGGIDPLEFRYHAMTDRVATTGTTWLGLTLGCCQCHTHKYDPISHTEYFRIMAFLNNADEPQLELPPDSLDEVWKLNRQKADALAQQLADKWPGTKTEKKEKPAGSKPDAKSSQPDELEQAFAAWLQDERQHAVEWHALVPESARANLPILTIEPDHAIFASGDTAKRDDYYVSFQPADQAIYALQLEALPDARLPAGGPGSTYYEGTLGDFYLTEITISVDGKSIPIQSASETYAKNRFGNNPVGASLALDGDVQTGWSVHDRQAERHVAVFVLDAPVAAGSSVEIQMSFGRHFASSLGRFRFNACFGSSESSKAAAPRAREYSAEISALLRKPANMHSDHERAQLLELFLLSEPGLATEANQIRELRKRPLVPTTLVLRERPAQHPRATHRHHRGEFLQPRELVQAGTPEVLPPMPDDFPKNRLGFAQWLVHSNNPLTARVGVNRAWEAFFGTGLVKTVDDFGLQGDAPSHPELLDWLAVTWMNDDEWSIKALHRRIVSSRTYRQSSQVNRDAREIDPNNRLLSYMPRIRLDAEVLRDTYLQASGKLSDKIGGPPVRPPQPPGITEVTFGSPKWNASQGDDRYRRSIYTFIKRTAPFAMFSTFDAPSGEACIAQRTRSNSPLQALTLLNDVMLLELARGLGEQLAQAPTESELPSDPEGSDSQGSDSQGSAPEGSEGAVDTQSPIHKSELATDRVALNDLFRRMLVRQPKPSELDLLAEYLDRQRTFFQKNVDEARLLLDLPLKKDPEDQPSSKQPSSKQPSKQPSSRASRHDEFQIANRAAWTATARAVFALDEAQTRE